ncbi:MAG: DNA methyltransferase [Thermodesulfobacteriota bacterium]|jgi:DNA modification methylase
MPAKTQPQKANKGKTKRTTSKTTSKSKSALATPSVVKAATQTVSITKAKGRPMLTWVGKRPLTQVTAFPAQHIETFDPDSDSVRRKEIMWKDWPKAYPHGGLLFHGDNKEVLAHLLANGFRGKVKLIYIDPPFDSGADYVRKVSLRGAVGTAKLGGEGYTLGEQIQYTDIWANDNYLQFMYERLLLLRELLATEGSIYLHCDETRSHHLRCLLDEVFGGENFLNSITWYFSNKPQFKFVSYFPRDVQTIHVYAKSQGGHFFGHQYIENIRARRQNVVTWDSKLRKRISKRDENGNILYRESTERLLGSMWDIPMVNPAGDEREGFPTQKPEALLEYVIKASSRPGELVLDSFVGSGTTVSVAQKLGRRWIGCDINKGAIQTTSKRLQTIIAEQKAAQNEMGTQGELIPTGETKTPIPAQLSFAVYRINDYDLQIQHNEAVNLACEHIGVTRTRTDAYFDGILGKRLAKITPFGHPLTLLDLEELKIELAARPTEERDVVLVCLGKETAVDAWLEGWNRIRKRGEVPNKIEVIELRTDPKYGKFFLHQPAKAKVNIQRDGEKILVEIKDFISPTIIERLKGQSGILSPQIDDWRAMVDSVMIDSSYDGSVFNITFSDVPEKKNDLVTGRYEFPAPDGRTTVAVKIIDMLGEEVLIAKEV